MNLNRNLDALNEFVGDQKEADIKYDFFIELGDNLYDYGLTNAIDGLLLLAREYQIHPIYPVLGNHDCLGNETS